MNKNASMLNNEIYNQLGHLAVLSPSITTEGFGSFVDRISDFITNKFDFIKDALGISSTTVRKTLSNDNIYIKEMIANHSGLLKVLNNLSYSTIETARVMSPVGIQTNLLDLSKDLKESIALIDDKLFDSLDRLDVLVSNVLRDENYRLQTKPLKIDSDAIAYADRLYAILNKHISPKLIEDTRLVKEILPNLSCLKDIYDNLLSLSELTSINRLNEINKLIENVYSKVEVMLMEIKHNKFELSKSVLNKLAVDLENNAKLVTVSINTIYLYNQCVLSMNNMIKKFKNVK